jgi:1-acyl-sn-glycerol-3-phosphate acyltransferase
MKIIYFFRSIIVLLLVIPVITILTSLAVVIGVLVFRINTTKIKIVPRLWSRIIATATGVKVKVEGMENLKDDRPYIFAANHQSQYDIFALDGYFMVDFRWVAKKELSRIPLVGRAMGLAGTVFIDRSKGRKAVKSLAEAAKRIANGTSVVVFPEGTRSPDGRLQPFKSGAMYLAIKSGVEIVPVAITGGFEIMQKNSFLIWPGNMLVRVGKPVSPVSYDQKQKQELADILHDKVQELMGE